MRRTILLLFLSAAAFGQSTGTTAVDPTTRDYTTTCSLPEIKAACRSYNELASVRDPDLIALLKVPNSYVCFREADDVFNVIAVDTPPAALFTKIQKTPNLYQVETAFITYQRFKNGQSDDYQLLIGSWTRVGQDGQLYFSTAPKQSPSMSVSESEIAYFEGYKNVSGGDTKYTLQIRRSTLRSSESFQWQTPAKDQKSTPNRGTDDITGHCITFN